MNEGIGLTLKSSSGLQLTGTASAPLVLVCDDETGVVDRASVVGVEVLAVVPIDATVCVSGLAGVI